MAQLTIRLQINPDTGKKDLIVALRSDEDALPHEHEQLHQQLVERLLEGGVLRADEVGQVVIEREEVSPQPQAAERREGGGSDDRRSLDNQLEH